MEQLRLLQGGLNLDDSIELMDPEDWSYAANIIAGRAYERKVREVENVRGTTALSGLSITTLIQENANFGVWTNQGADVAWTINATPSVSLSSGQSSRQLNLLFSTTATGVITVAFNYSISNFTANLTTLFCRIKTGSTVIETKQLVTTSSTGTASFSFNTVANIDNIDVYVSGGTIAQENVNLVGNNGDYETDPSTWNIYTFGSGIFTRDSSIKFSGNYSSRFQSTSTIGTIMASAMAGPEHLQVGDLITVRAKVYIPSSAPLSGDMSQTLEIHPNTGFFPSISHSFINVTQITPTLASCLNTWQTVEFSGEVASSTAGDNLVFLLEMDNPFFATTLVGGVLNVDEFYVLAGQSTRTVTLSSPNVQRSVVASDILDANSQLIGTIRSAIDDISYLFFYNTDPTKHCIIKLDNGVLSIVLKWSGLNFSPLKEYRITGGIADDMLYFTDNYNSPRCVSLTRYSSGSVPSSQEEILWMKRGPQFPPKVLAINFGSAPAYDDVQFSYQYQYLDGQLSVVSPWSPMTIGEGQSGTTKINAVSVGVSVSETIPALVKRIKFLARKGNNGVPFYIGDLNQPFNTDPAVYPILYTEQNIGLVATRYLQNSELVPILAGTCCITKSRGWFGNYLEGYDTPSSGIAITGELVDTDDATFPKAGIGHSHCAKFRLGVVFFDDQGRSSGVMDNSWTYETSKTIKRNETRKRYKYRITGTPPSWASSYALVMTKDILKREFYEGWGIHNTGSFVYVTEASDGTETYNATYVSSTKYVRLFMSPMNSASIFYTLKAGDKVLVTNNTSNVTYGPLQVRKITGQYLYVDAVDIGATSFQYNYQIFTPNTDAENVFYEIGQRRKIVGGALDTTDYYINGDAICRNVNTDNITGYEMPQMRYRPNAGDWNRSLGKIYVKSEIGQVRKENFIRHSSPFIPGIEVNGLSEFSSGDEGNVPIEAVKIQRLQPTSKEATDGEVILAICNSDTYSIYVDEARMSTNDGQSFLLATTKVIGDVRKQRSGFGTLHPESVHEEDGDVFWWDHLSRSYVRYATNGIFPISEYKAVTHFEEQAELTDETDLVFTGYDPFYKLIVVTFTDAATATKKTIGFSLPKERWISFYDYAPDGYVIGSKKMYSVKDGTVYSHDAVGSNFNVFYGVPNNSALELSFNDDPATPKEWKAIQVQASPNMYSFSNANQVVGADVLKADISNRHGQATDIRYSEFEVDENMIYGEIRGDANSAGGVVNGDPIYSNTMQCLLTFSGGTNKQIVMVKAGCEPSRGHNL